MKYQYNDYVEAVRMYLQHYEEFNAYVKTLTEQIADYEQRLAAEGPVPKTQAYNSSPGGARRPGSIQESFCLKREFMVAEIERMQREINETRAVLDRLDLAIMLLPKNDKELMLQRWIYKVSWEKTAEIVNASVGYCRSRSKKLVVKLAGIMFGPNATPPNRRLIFYKEPEEELHDKFTQFSHFFEQNLAKVNKNEQN